MKTLLSLIFLIFVNIASSQNKEISYWDIKNTLKPEMGYDSIISRFGKPDILTGSGIRILIYNMIDSSSVIIGCTGYKIFYTHINYPKGIRVSLIPKYSITVYNWQPEITAAVSYEIKRECDTLMIPPIEDIKRGKYNFIIYVNNEGHVVKTYINHHVSPNVPNEKIREILTKSIKNIKFSKNILAPEEEIGSITYTFNKVSRQRKK